MARDRSKHRASVAEMAKLPSVDGTLLEKLSTREAQVLLAIVNGESPSSIAQRLGVSARTVASYRTRIKSKTNQHTTIALIRTALRQGIIE